MFFYRTTQMPSIQKILELERIIVVDGAGNNVPVSASQGNACLVGEFVQGPFTPTVINNPGDINNLYMNDPSKFSLISQGGFDGAADDQNGAGIAFDGNGWAELKGKSFSGLVIQRVDTDMIVKGDGTSSAKAFVSFSLTVGAGDLNGGSTATIKDIYIPAGTRFADNTTAGTSNGIVALSQAIRIPSGTACTGTLAIGISFTQDATGLLTYVASGATTGATAFFVKGKTLASTILAHALDTATSSANTTISGTISSVDGADAATAIFAPAGGGAQGSTLGDCIALCYPNAIQKTLPGTDATNNIIAIWSARNWKGGASNIKAIRTALWSANAVVASASGRGRICCVTAAPAKSASYADRTTALNAYLALVHTTDSVTDPDSDRYWACGPYQQVFSQEMNQDIVISACGFRVAMKVNEFNAGRSQYLTSVGSPYNSTIQSIDSQEPAFAAFPLQDNPLGMSEFVSMKAAGVAWLVKDRTAGWWFYSGVTGVSPTGAYANRLDDNRRSFADEVQDVIFGLSAYYSKLPGTPDRQDAFAGTIRAYTDQLVNPGPGVEQRALAAQVLDGGAAGNTQTLNAQGIYFYSVSITMVGSQKDIVINTQIGTNVVITQVG
jgi:hypothetical protein